MRWVSLRSTHPTEIRTGRIVFQSASNGDEPFTLLQYIKAESPKFMTKISAFFSTEIDIFCFISWLWNEKNSVIQNLSPLFFSLRQVDEFSHRLGSFFTPHLLIYAVGFAALYSPYGNPHWSDRFSRRTERRRTLHPLTVYKSRKSQIHDKNFCIFFDRN